MKVFDTFTSASLDLIHLLTCLYSNVFIYKPETSRQANSEKFIICKGFTLSNTEIVMKKIYSIYDFFSEKEKNNQVLGKDFFIKRFLTNDAPIILRNKLEEINSCLGNQQLDAINSTINLINNQSKSDKMKILTKTNIDKCIKWCKTYNQPYYKKFSQNNLFL